MLFFPTVDEDVAYFRSQGYTGSINDMHYKAMGDLGYTGALNDRIHAYLTFKYGSFYEAMRDLRNGTSVFSLLSSYAANGLDPALVFDFIGNYFRKDSTESTITEALVHNSATAGNATMQDGYGPELVTNGTFDTDSDWTIDGGSTGWSITGGVLQGSSATGNVTQDITTVVGREYVISFKISGYSGSGDVYVRPTSSADTGDYVEGDGSYSSSFTATSTTTTMKMRGRPSQPFTGNIDNISVREAPAIKWRPHNLLKYSNDFTDASWVKNAATATPNAAAAPDGLTAADKLKENTGSTSHYIYQVSNSALITSATWTFSVYIKDAGDGRFAQLRPSGLGTGVAYATFDPTDGSLTESGGPDLVTTTSQSVGNGWYRISMTCSADIVDTADGVNITLSNSETAGENPSYTGDGTSGIYIYGAHLYRSDLGGMVNNPETGDSYVPTTSTVRYLPRVGHHIYNGDDWVNEGLLHESEARTNQMVYSGDLTDASWTSPRLTVGAVTAGSPFGTYQALTPANHGTTWAANAFQIGKAITLGSTYVGWALVKYSAGSGWFVVNMYDTGRLDERAWFDLQNGVVGTKDALIVDHGMIDYGDGWWLCWASSNTNSNNGGLSLEVTNGDNVITSSTSDTILIAGSQYEQGSTPSSYIPTVGATVTRAAETLTVPAANMPWPEPVFIGPELVTNGTFDTDSDWTKGTGWTIGSGVATHAAGTGSDLEQSGLTAGKLYVLTLDVTAVRAASTLYVVSNPNIYQIIGTTVTTGQKVATFIAPTNGKLSIRLGWPADVDIDNVSVKEINPLSVSIQMDGRMTYADTGADNGKLIRWEKDVANKLWVALDSAGASTGSPYWVQRSLGVSDFTSSLPQFSPDTNVPFNFSSRHGSTFLNGAVGGTAGIADTTPTSLPDLSASNLSLGHNLMGTIGQFRMWNEDITDAGIVEASSPSLEPSLSLTFDGSQTSFTVSDWSE